MKARFVLLIVLLLTLIHFSSKAQVPRILSYQGVLTDSLGNAKPNGAYSLTFRLFPSGSGGSLLWSETKSVQVARGFFSCVLGDATPFPDSVKFDRQYWLSIQVGGGPELVPRIAVTSVGYSLTASKVARPISPPLVSSEIADSTITSAKIARGQVVKSLNGLKDSVTLAAGANVVIAPLGNKLTISATSSGGGAFTLPYAGIVTADPTAFMITNNGNGGAGWFETTSPASSNPALFARSSGPGSAVEAVALGNAAYAIDGFTSSNNAWAGYFTILNANNKNSALFSQTNGGGESVYGYQLGTGIAGKFEINNTSNDSSALKILTNGRGHAGSFIVNNGVNHSDAFNAMTNGTGHAGSFTINNPISSSYAVNANTNGTSSAGNFVNSNANHTAIDAALYAESNSPSPAVHGVNRHQGSGVEGLAFFGSGDGVYGHAYALGNGVSGLTSGTGTAVKGNGGSAGRAGWFVIDTASNGKTALEGSTVGEGPAAWFKIDNVSSINPALHAQTNGSGLAAEILSTSTTNSLNPALRVTYNGAKNAAEFSLNNPGNSFPAVSVLTTGTGSAVFAQSNLGPAISGSNISGGRAGQFITSNGGDAVYASSGGLSTSAVRAQAGSGAYIFFGTQNSTNNHGMHIEMNPSNTYAGLDIVQGASGTGIQATGSNAIVASTAGTGAVVRYGIRSFAGASPQMAGSFGGDVNVSGTLSKTAGSFKIDHPLDPANKYLYHSFVESPDMKNIYDGVIILDAGGEARVDLPDWFEALNKDFRYQLTAIGAPGPGLYIAEKVQGNRFKIAGGKPGMEVSWQVTGIRKDAYAEKHRIPVEEDKPAVERGFYRHPEVFGFPEQQGVDWARDPKLMEQLKTRREQALNQSK